MKIFIAAGHGGKDSGAVFDGIAERDVVINIVDNAVEMLQKVTDVGHEIIKAPDDYALEETVKFINQEAKEAPEDLAVEVHMNSNHGIPGTGTETYYGEAKVATKIHAVIVSVLGLRDRGVKYGMQLYFNRATFPPSALVEMGFLNNPDDLTVVRQKGALALARGIAQAVGLPDPAVLPPPQSGQKGPNKISQLLQKIIDYLKALKEAEEVVPAS